MTTDLKNLKEKLKYLIEDGSCNGCPYSYNDSCCCTNIAEDVYVHILELENRAGKETVNHPDHYRGEKYECIDVMTEVFGVEETRAFCKLNAFKYMWRADRKGSQEEDIAKADWYIGKYRTLGELTESKRGQICGNT